LIIDLKLENSFDYVQQRLLSEYGFSVQR